MGRKASGKERVDIIEKPQSNGSVYVYRRVSAYNSEKGYYTYQRAKADREKCTDQMKSFQPDRRRQRELEKQAAMMLLQAAQGFRHQGYAWVLRQS